MCAARAQDQMTQRFARLGHVTVMNALIERRASVSGSLKRASRAYCCSAGQQPIHMAAQRGHTDAMLLLLDRRAEVDALDHARQSPLFYATSFGNLAQTELLLDRRADVRRSDARALTPIAFAVIFGRAEIVQLLVARGADVLPDKTGLSIVHLACVFNSGAQTVRALAASSADMNSAIRPRPWDLPWAGSGSRVRFGAPGCTACPKGCVDHCVAPPFEHILLVVLLSIMGICTCKYTRTEKPTNRQADKPTLIHAYLHTHEQANQQAVATFGSQLLFFGTLG